MNQNISFFHAIVGTQKTTDSNFEEAPTQG